MSKALGLSDIPSLIEVATIKYKLRKNHALEMFISTATFLLANIKAKVARILQEKNKLTADKILNPFPLSVLPSELTR